MIQVWEDETQLGQSHVVASAAFEPVPQAQGCSLLAAEGACEVKMCEVTTGPIPNPRVNAGTVHLSCGGHRMDLAPNEENLYTASRSERLLVGGQPLTVWSTGGAFPAFSAELEAPGPITMEAPPFGAMNTVERGQSVTLRWEPGASDSVIKLFFSFPADGGLGQALCTFNAAAGTGVLAAELWRRIRTDDEVRFFSTVERRRTFNLGNNTLLVAAANGVFDDQGAAIMPRIHVVDGSSSSSGGGGRACTNTCQWAGDGECDDGGPGSTFAACSLGTDCQDCGPR